MVMARASEARQAANKPDRSQIMLNLLEAVERDGGQSQRHLASELDVALGLINTYLARCIKKGLVKARQAPARRYIYYLTPRGLTEKSRLTVQYLTSSFGFFREAKADCFELFQTARERGFANLVLAGKSDLAEIVSICASDGGCKIVAVVDPLSAGGAFSGVPLVRAFDAVTVPFDAVLITDLVDARKTCETAIDRFGAERVLVPALLRLRGLKEQHR